MGVHIAVDGGDVFFLGILLEGKGEGVGACRQGMFFAFFCCFCLIAWWGLFFCRGRRGGGGVGALTSRFSVCVGVCFPSQKQLTKITSHWIPFGDHPLKLERYRED